MLHASQSDKCDEMLIKFLVSLNARADLDIGTRWECLHVLLLEVHGQRVKKDVVNERREGSRALPDANELIYLVQARLCAAPQM